MSGLVVILRNSLSNLSGSYANDGVFVRVVSRISPEYLNSQGTFLEPSRTAQGMFGDVPELPPLAGQRE